MISKHEITLPELPKNGDMVNFHSIQMSGFSPVQGYKPNDVVSCNGENFIALNPRTGPITRVVIKHPWLVELQHRLNGRYGYQMANIDIIGPVIAEGYSFIVEKLTRYDYNEDMVSDFCLWIHDTIPDVSPSIDHVGPLNTSNEAAPIEFIHLVIQSMLDTWDHSALKLSNVERLVSFDFLDQESVVLEIQEF